MTAAWHAGGMRRAITVAALAALAGWTPFRTVDPDVEAGNRAYAEGRYDDALAAYDRAARRGGVDEGGLAFDRGTAELALAGAAKDAAERARLTERALEDLKQATHSKDARIRGAASYNRGNSLMDQGKLEDAIEAYKQALRDDNQLDDARLNLELALRRRQREKAQQSGQGQGGQGQGQGQQGQQGQQGSQDPGGSGDAGGSADPQRGSNSGGDPQSGSNGGGKPQSGSNGGGGSNQPRNGSNDPGDPGDPGSNAKGSNQAPDPSGGTGGPGRGSQQPKRRPSRGRSNPASPKTPADGKLDDLDEYSRKLQKDGARRRATGHAADPQHDW